MLIRTVLNNSKVIGDRVILPVDNPHPKVEKLLSMMGGVFDVATNTWVFPGRTPGEIYDMLAEVVEKGVAYVTGAK